MRLISLSLLLAMTGSASAVTLGQTDDFQDGTTQGWLANLLGNGSHPAPPTNVPNGGPLGAGDKYLGLTSVGGGGNGSRMVALNLAQWSGDYMAAGVTSLRMSLNNLGNTALDVRILIEKVGATGPTDVATTTGAFHLNPGSGWTSASFSLNLGDLTTLLGDKAVALSGASAIRIYHSPTAAFPGPAIAAQLGVDNIQAVPEPTTLSALAVVSLGFLRNRKRS